MVLEVRLGERLDGHRQNFETVEDRLVDGFGSGCAAAGYDCAVVERILVEKGRLAAVDQENGQDSQSFEDKMGASCHKDRAGA